MNSSQTTEFEEDNADVYISSTHTTNLYSNGTQEDLYFDTIVGTLQDAVLQPDFMQLQDNFMKNNCMIFEDKEENKIQYTHIFMQYQQLIEKNILDYLTEKIPDFKMQVLSHLLESRMEQIDEELLQMLNSFTDFEVFKQLMIQHRRYYAQENNLKGLTIRGAVCKLP